MIIVPLLPRKTNKQPGQIMPENEITNQNAETQENAAVAEQSAPDVSTATTNEPVNEMAPTLSLQAEISAGQDNGDPGQPEASAEGGQPSRNEEPQANEAA